MRHRRIGSPVYLRGARKGPAATGLLLAGAVPATAAERPHGPRHSRASPPSRLAPAAGGAAGCSARPAATLPLSHTRAAAAAQRSGSSSAHCRDIHWPPWGPKPTSSPVRLQPPELPGRGGDGLAVRGCQQLVEGAAPPGGSTAGIQAAGRPGPALPSDDSSRDLLPSEEHAAVKADGPAGAHGCPAGTRLEENVIAVAACHPRGDLEASRVGVRISNGDHSFAASGRVPEISALSATTVGLSRGREAAPEGAAATPAEDSARSRAGGRSA